MTFSIVAVDPGTGDVGVAVASKFLAVGNIVPWVEAGRGAVATQALCNATFGPDGLALLAELPAPTVLEELLSNDQGQERRQVGIVDVHGGAAIHTGSGCQPWAGHRTGAGYAWQGNCLTGPEVINEMVTTFEGSDGLLVDRLFAALRAGDRAGGDRRGRQSAAIKVFRKGAGYQGLGDTVMDLRVDDDPQRMVELARLIGIHKLFFPTPGDSERLQIEGAVLAELRTFARENGHSVGDARGWAPDLRAAIDAYIGTENLEERVDLDARTIDAIALDYLRAKQSRSAKS